MKKTGTFDYFGHFQCKKGGRSITNGVFGSKNVALLKNYTEMQHLLTWNYEGLSNFAV